MIRFASPGTCSYPRPAHFGFGFSVSMFNSCKKAGLVSTTPLSRKNHPAPHKLNPTVRRHRSPERPAARRRRPGRSRTRLPLATRRALQPLTVHGRTARPERSSPGRASCRTGTCRTPAARSRSCPRTASFGWLGVSTDRQSRDCVEVHAVLGHQDRRLVLVAGADVQLPGVRRLARTVLVALLQREPLVVVLDHVEGLLRVLVPASPSRHAADQCSTARRTAGASAGTPRRCGTSPPALPGGRVDLRVLADVRLGQRHAQQPHVVELDGLLNWCVHSFHVSSF